MAPFKQFFLGSSAPPTPRLTSCQKCLRTSDIARVGATPCHLTFFEMLGNFSFGDYFKEGAIELAWGLLTDTAHGFGLPADRLWITVFEEDHETADLWQKIAGVPSSRILLRGPSDNFWQMGDTGPCGPCTEVLYDFRDPPGESPPDEDRDEAVEIWNLVLMQFNRQADGSLERLPRKNVDTGAGLERLAWVLQGKNSVFETDLLDPLYRTFHDFLSEQMKDEALSQPERIVRRARIAADHLRSASFALAANWDSDLLQSFLQNPDLAYKAFVSGIRPGNTGRNYVIRQLIRRGVLALTVPQAASISPEEKNAPPRQFAAAFSLLKQIFGTTYAELLVQFAKPTSEGLSRSTTSADRFFDIGVLIYDEASAFSSVLRVALRRFEQIAAQLPDRVFPGGVAFELHDTYGFPVDLTRELAAEYGLTLDEESFRREMEQQRERARVARAREAGGWSELGEPLAPEFTGYDHLSDTAQITFLRWRNSEVQIGLDRTPFYAEAGGQIGDTGYIRVTNASTETIIRVEDTQREIGTILHIGRIVSPPGPHDTPRLIPISATVTTEVDAERRAAIQRAHTATHLLHRALRDILAETATQAGSLVAPDYLRFDFHHSEALSENLIESLETRIVRWILQDLPVRASLRPFKEALAEGVTALFGEKYGEIVRVVEIVGVSKELCGGTHLNRTLEVGPFKITSEESIGAGIRRIEALTGLKALEWIQATSRSVSRIARDLNTGIDQLLTRWEGFKQELVEAQKEAERWRARYLAKLVDEWSASEQKVVTAILEAIPPKNLSEAARAFISRHPDRAIALGSAVSGRAAIVLSYGDRFEPHKPADVLVREVAPLIGGGGGGRPRFAQAGGSNIAALPEAIRHIRDALSR